MDAVKLASQLRKLESVLQAEGVSGLDQTGERSWIKIEKLGVTVKLSLWTPYQRVTLVYQDGSDDHPVDGVLHLIQLKQFVQKVKDVEILEGTGTDEMARLSAQAGRLVREIRAESVDNLELEVNKRWPKPETPWCSWEGWPYLMSCRRIFGKEAATWEGLGVWLTRDMVLASDRMVCYGANVGLPLPLWSWGDLIVPFKRVVWPLEKVRVALVLDPEDGLYGHLAPARLLVFGQFIEKKGFVVNHAYDLSITPGYENLSQQQVRVALQKERVDENRWFEIPDREMLEHLKATSGYDGRVEITALDGACAFRTEAGYSTGQVTNVAGLQAEGEFTTWVSLCVLEQLQRVLGVQRFFLTEGTSVEVPVRSVIYGGHSTSIGTDRRTLQTLPRTIEIGQGVYWSGGVEQVVASRSDLDE